MKELTLARSSTYVQRARWRKESKQLYITHGNERIEITSEKLREGRARKKKIVRERMERMMESVR